MKLKDMPIRKKLMSAILLISSVVLLLMCSAYVVFEYYSYKNTLKKNVSTLGVIIAANSSAALAFESQADATEILNALKIEKHIAAACLYDKQGNLFAKYPSGISRNLLPAKPQMDGYRFKDAYLTGFEPVIQKSDRLGTLFIKSDMVEMQTKLNSFLMIAFILITGSILIAYILSTQIEKAISIPIITLEETARIVAEKYDYSVRAVKISNDELGSLTDSFNQMLTQIEAQNIKLNTAKIESSKLAAIVESSNDAIISKTLEGIITSWNDAAERMFGYSPDEMIGQSIFKLVPADRISEEKHILSRMRTGDRFEQFETVMMTKDERMLDVSLSISPIYDARGDIIGLSKIARDITERKQEEKRKNDFIGVVSHELKTPLTSITAYIQILLKKAQTTGEDSFKISALTRAEGQARKMSAMIQDFLSLTRLEEGKLQITKETFELHPLIEEVASDAQFLTSAHIIQFKGCDDVKVNADKDKMGQVLMNLLSNAIKYSPNGGTITISCEINLGKVKVCVIDNGIGINPEEQKSLFHRFYRVKNEKVKTVSGFGIGLYLVSEILRYHNSKIEVESEEGAGSTFYFTLDVQS